jgi:hypothetical protein
MSAKNILNLNHIYAIRIIRIVYVIGLILIVLGGIIAVIGSFSMMGQSAGGGLLSLIASIVAMLVGLLFWRLICELWIVTFGIYERLGGRY